jgi:hypothetical protein
MLKTLKIMRTDDYYRNPAKHAKLKRKLSFVDK